MASSRRFLPIASIMLAVAGVFLLGWFARVMLSPDLPPYRYELLQEGGADAFPELNLDTQPGLSVRKYALHITETDEPLVTFHVGERDNSDAGAVLLDWKNQIGEALITTAPPISELTGLVAAVAEHVPEEAVVLGWWDTTRRLELLAGVETPFQRNLSKPIFIPDAWAGRRDSIEEIERQFWNLSASEEGAESISFDSFQEALLADTKTGADKLRALVGEREAYLVLHIADAYKLSAMHPTQLGIGYREFTNLGDLHGVISQIKDWLKEQGYENYAVERRGKTLLRVYFLTDDSSAETLLAQALPFTSSQPLLLEELQVVYQKNGYWVYKIQSSSNGDNT